MKKHVVMIFGRAQHGKDTLANFLADELIERDKLVKRTSFAAPLKEAAIQLVGMPSDVAYGGEAERRAWSAYGKDAREWLQWIGTELGREQIAKTIWIDRMLDKIWDENDPAEFIIISDGRFVNERKLVELGLLGQHDFTALKIFRPDKAQINTHISEAEIDLIDEEDFTWIIENDGDLEDLQALARDLAEELSANNLLEPADTTDF